MAYEWRRSRYGRDITAPAVTLMQVIGPLVALVLVDFAVGVDVRGSAIRG